MKKHWNNWQKREILQMLKAFNLSGIFKIHLEEKTLECKDCTKSFETRKSHSRIFTLPDALGKKKKTIN